MTNFERSAPEPHASLLSLTLYIQTRSSPFSAFSAITWWTYAKIKTVCSLSLDGLLISTPSPSHPPNSWDFADLQFATDAPLHGAGTTQRMFEFPEDSVCC